jgi:glycosyltransferase domain-containing protein
LKNAITFILTIKGREDFTKRWYTFANNRKLPFKILIGDGDPASKINEFLESLKDDNHLDYKYYQFNDKTPQDFFKKIVTLLEKVETPYVMLCDNDDYIVEKNVLKCINFLEKNPDYVSCGGTMLGFNCLKRKEKNVILNEKIIYSIPQVSQEAPLERVVAYTNNYSFPCWYNVFRTDKLYKSFKLFVNTGICDFLLMEYFVAMSTTIFGKHAFKAEFTHYIRQTNSSQVNKTIPSFVNRIVNANLGGEIKSVLDTLSDQLVSLDKTETSENVKNSIAKAYISYMEKDKSSHKGKVDIKKVKNFLKRYNDTFRYFVPSLNKLFCYLDRRNIEAYFRKNKASLDEIKAFREQYKRIVKDVEKNTACHY